MNFNFFSGTIIIHYNMIVMARRRRLWLAGDGYGSWSHRSHGEPPEPRGATGATAGHRSHRSHNRHLDHNDTFYRRPQKYFCEKSPHLFLCEGLSKVFAEIHT